LSYFAQLCEIARGKYKNAEITTEDFLKLKKVYLTRKNSLKNKLSKLLLKAKKIAVKSKIVFLSKSVLALTAVINGSDCKKNTLQPSTIYQQ
jgi:hypothetical protein